MKKLAVVIFLRERAVLAVPRPYNGLACVYRPDVAPTETVRIVPVISIDSWLLPHDDYWQNYATLRPSSKVPVGAATFIPGDRAIYMPGGWSRPERQRGLKMLHEGLHAYDRLIRKRHMPKPRWRRERNAEYLVVRVLRAIGGQAFTDYLDTLISEVASQYASSGERFCFRLPFSRQDDPPLDHLLWPALSPAFRRDRALEVERCAVAHFYEVRYGAKALAHYGAYVRTNHWEPDDDVGLTSQSVAA